ncbi:AMP-binding protein [Fuchsiella alkaliacetigena]|uniref:AMP-binding protein n=1 Tax=Fuchsiella alkaliacetigena TaxID=957042 RepID=UPI002009FC00|nr:AMP-binding protein [Fuchsiella alkaliacetigena]MCK8825139.1 AMP-binding protein [Fuchsiella alkaliacetigena]
MGELEITLGELLDKRANQYSQQEAVVYADQGIRYSYRQFRNICNRAAKGLMKLGIETGEHIAIWGHNHPQWLISQFATGKMGGVLVTVNTDYRAKELEYLLKNSDAKTLILSSGEKNNYVETLYQICPELKNSEPGELNSQKLPQLKNVIYIGEGQTPPGMYSWNEIMDLGKGVPAVRLKGRQNTLQPDQVINIQYTSGTTGFHKGVMLTHTNLINNAHYVAECMNLTAADRMCIPVPFFHCVGCGLGTLACVTKGATMVPLVKFDAEEVLKVVAAEECTALHGMPNMFVAELEHPNFAEYDLSSLRTGIMAGEACPDELVKKVIKKMGATEMTIAYGLTEASPVITQTRFDDPIEKRISTVGRALPNVEVKIVDPETGLQVENGTPGELCTRGFHVMEGYYKMPSDTKVKIDQEGWLYTGDLAVMDEQGYCQIKGRIKDLIIRDGERICPSDVEKYFYKYESVKSAQVVGIPDEDYGEEVMAYVQLKEGDKVTAQDLYKELKGKIPEAELPKKIEIVDSYPLTASGKVQKYKLREEAIEKYGLEDVGSIETA